MSEWTAEQVKDALRRRHPATQRMGARTIPGPWTCIEEWCGIDLLALGCHAERKVVGYEVKVSRGDYRQELRNPTKRAATVAMCHAFYFAVPKGLLLDHELGAEQVQLGEDRRGLYVPDDVGLVVVDGRGSRVVKPAPHNPAPEPVCGALRGDGASGHLHNLIRWVSARPDPRHAGVVEESRQVGREIRSIHRRHWENVA